MICEIDGCGRPCEGTTDKCASHNREARKELKLAEFKFKKIQGKSFEQKPIPKVSNKMARLLQEYTKIKRGWIKGKMCAVLKNAPATEVHHMMGRTGYADQFARDNDIPLLIDTRFWLPVSRAGHRKVELLPDWAKKQGFSLSRLEKR